MSDLANNAVSGNDKQAFFDFRKLTALGIAMTAGETAGAAAAMIADKAVFQKTVEVAVGKGIMRADEAVEAMIDRTVRAAFRRPSWALRRAAQGGQPAHLFHNRMCYTSVRATG